MLLSIIMFVVITQFFCCWFIVYAFSYCTLVILKCLHKWCKISVINDSSQLSVLTIDSKLRSCSPVSFVTAIETISTYSTLPLSSLSKEIKKIYHLADRKKQVLRYTSLYYDIPNTLVINGFLYSTSDTKITALAPASLAFCAYNTIIQSVKYTSQISDLFKYRAVAFVFREVHQNSITNQI